MPKPATNNKGIMLFIVLGVLLLVTTLAGVILNLILSNYRLTHHQTNRIRAYYAAMAGVNLTREMLRTGQWSVPATGSGAVNRLICTGTNWAGTGAACHFNNSGLPYDINVTINATNATLGSSPAITGTAPLSAKAEFTYTD